ERAAVSALHAAGLQRWHDPAWRATALVGGVLLGALVLALAGRGGGRAAAVALAAGALPVVAVVLGRDAARALRGAGGRGLVLALPLAFALLLLPMSLLHLPGRRGAGLLAVALLSALCGVVLVGTDLRERARRAAVRADRS